MTRRTLSKVWVDTYLNSQKQDPTPNLCVDGPVSYKTQTRKENVRPLSEEMVEVLDTYKTRAACGAAALAIEEVVQRPPRTVVAALATFLAEYRVEAHQVPRGEGSVHQGEKQNHCTECGKDFSRKADLILHIRRVHHGEKPYPCTDCGKYFSTRRNLNRHIKSVHMGEKPYPCTDCEKNFAQKTSLNLHIRTAHNGEKPHVCPVCGRGFGRSEHLRSHIRGVHNGEKRHKCPDCGKAFARKQGMMKHMKAHNNG